MAVNLVNSNDITVTQTGNNIELQIDSDVKTQINQNTSNITDAQQDILDITGQILWTNSDPTQAISQTTNISLSSNDYDILEVIYAQSTINTDLMYSTKFLKGGSTRMRISSADGSNMYRGITYLTDTSYRIDLPYSDNTKIEVSTISIPLYIIGYKTGLFS